MDFRLFDSGREEIIEGESHVRCLSSRNGRDDATALSVADCSDDEI